MKFNPASLVFADITYTQSLTLSDQLKSGIRFLDIRCRIDKNDKFKNYHGGVYLFSNFEDVLETSIDFLDEHSGEMICIRVKNDKTKKAQQNKFQKIFAEYYKKKKYRGYFWIPADSEDSKNPPLRECRGKIVFFLQDFDNPGDYGIDWGTPNIQDEFEVKDNWKLYDKWSEVKSQLWSASKNRKSEDDIYINFLSGSYGSFPYFVASGKSSHETSAPLLSTGVVVKKDNRSKWPDFPRKSPAFGLRTIYFKGTNCLTYEYLGKGKFEKTGVIMADFPGPGLIKRVISLNDRYEK